MNSIAPIKINITDERSTCVHVMISIGVDRDNIILLDSYTTIEVREPVKLYYLLFHRWILVKPKIHVLKRSRQS